MEFLLDYKSLKIPVVSTFINNEILQNFEGKNHSLESRTVATASNTNSKKWS